MVNVTDNMPDDLREYRDALAAWDLAAAKWLGLDPEKVFKFDADRAEYDCLEARWAATSQLTTRLGHLHAYGMSGDGEVITFTGGVSLDYDDSRAFWEAVGPKPKGPWETPEALAAFEQLRRMA